MVDTRSIDPENEEPRHKPSSTRARDKENALVASEKQPTTEVGHPGFIVKFSLSSFSEQSDLRLTFWRRLYGAMEDLEGIEDFDSVMRNSENYLIADFSNSLLEEAVRFRDARRHSDFINFGGVPFSFKIENVSYGSLMLDVSILGIGPFLKFFFDNPDIVVAFLETGAPKAFERSVRYAIQNHPRAAIYPNERLERIFNDLEEDGAGKPSPEPPSSGWAKVFSLSSRIPFLLPLIISLVVLYVAASLINGERDRLTVREAALDSREKDMRSANDNRVTKLEALTLDLVKQLRAEKPSPASGPQSTAAKTASPQAASGGS